MLPKWYGEEFLIEVYIVQYFNYFVWCSAVIEELKTSGMNVCIASEYSNTGMIYFMPKILVIEQYIVQ